MGENSSGFILTGKKTQTDVPIRGHISKIRNISRDKLNPPEFHFFAARSSFLALMKAFSGRKLFTGATLLSSRLCIY
jgi:hypothetical protein